MNVEKKENKMIAKIFKTFNFTNQLLIGDY